MPAARKSVLLLPSAQVFDLGHDNSLMVPLVLQTAHLKQYSRRMQQQKQLTAASQQLLQKIQQKHQLPQQLFQAMMMKAGTSRMTGNPTCLSSKLPAALKAGNTSHQAALKACHQSTTAAAFPVPGAWFLDMTLAASPSPAPQPVVCMVRLGDGNLRVVEDGTAAAPASSSRPAGLEGEGSLNVDFLGTQMARQKC
jgi:hypothetical protein